MIENLQKIQTYQIKSKPIVGSVVFCLFFPRWLHLQSPRIGLNWIFWARRRVSPLTLRLLGSSSAVSVWLAGGSAPGPGSRVCSGPVRSGGQMRVSWCHRLDGRMLSTFSMMKFRGANSVLRNCRETRRHKTLKSVLTELFIV